MTPLVSARSQYGQRMTLELASHDIVHMDKNTFMWIQLTSFSIGPDRPTEDLLNELLASPGYAHDYASPFDPNAEIAEPALHGRWWRSAISGESFTPTSASEAEAVLQTWADNQEWTEPGFRQPPEVQERLQRVYVLLRSGDLFRLNNPVSDDEHEYGFVTGNMGFHEFVVLDRVHRCLHVIVASDD